ncbi:hypothetical protein HYV83_00275 [Candidatus Woesearchaeota archaeon]|nr:hypothetical protein [Candidatus Woesearchaeota archaeon]
MATQGPLGGSPDLGQRLTKYSLLLAGGVTIALPILDLITPGRLLGSIADFYTKHPLQASLVTAGGLAAVATAADVAVSASKHAYNNVTIRGRTIFRNGAVAVSALMLLVTAGVYDRFDRGTRFIWESYPVPAAIATAVPTGTPTSTLEAVVTQTPAPEATATPTTYATATPAPTHTPTPQPTVTPTPYATATPTPQPTATPLPTATPTPQPTVTPTATPTPVNLDAIVSAVRWGISYNLAKDMHASNPEGFYTALGVVPAARSQVPGWFDGNAANGEVTPLNGIAVAVDEIAGRSRFYLQNNAAATFTVQLQTVTNFLVRYLTQNPSRVGDVTIITQGR